VVAPPWRRASSRAALRAGAARAWGRFGRRGPLCVFHNTLGPAAARTLANCLGFFPVSGSNPRQFATARRSAPATCCRTRMPRAATRAPLRRHRARGPRQAPVRAVGPVPLGALAARCGSGGGEGGAARCGSGRRRWWGRAVWGRPRGEGGPARCGGGRAESHAAARRATRPRGEGGAAGAGGASRCGAAARCGGGWRRGRGRGESATARHGAAAPRPPAPPSRPLGTRLTSLSSLG
jgi:hypothetical protein